MGGRRGVGRHGRGAVLLACTATDIRWFSTSNLRFADTLGLLLEMFWPGLSQQLLGGSQAAGTIQVPAHNNGLGQPDGRDRGHVDCRNGVVEAIGRMPVADCVGNRRGSDSQFAWGHKAGSGGTTPSTIG